MDLIEEKKNLKSKGWGSWAGAGIEEKKISNEDKIQKRKLEIVYLFKKKNNYHYN